MIEVSLKALRERHPQLQWTQHVGTHGGSFAYRGVRPGYAVTLVPYVQDCREGTGPVRSPIQDELRSGPRYLWLQQSNTGDPQSLYTGTLHGEKSAFDVALDTPQEVRSALAHVDVMPPLPRDPDEWVLLG